MFLFNNKKWPELPIDEIKKRARILVIDDEEFYYTPLFEKDGYNIDKWDEIDDLKKLESGYFDIILLDIHGVGKKYTDEQGLGILKHLRKENPTQIIMAYSNADWSLKYKQFFDLADSTLDKRSDYIVFKQKLDILLKRRFSLGFYLDKIVNLTNPHINNAEKVKKLSKKAILSKSTAPIERYLKDNIEDKDIIVIVLMIIQCAIGIAAI